MTNFVDGPAAGETLLLQRAPYFLRVVRGDKWDALDQLTDTVAPDEQVYVYRIVRKPGWCHIRKKGGGGCYTMAEYALYEPQPAASDVRDNERWQRWTAAQVQERERWEAMRQ